MKNLTFKTFAAIAIALSLTSCSASKSVPVPTDLDLVGPYHREPFEWTAERFAPHVSFTDTDGSEKWLFDAFLFIEGSDVSRGLLFTLSPDAHSARKESWEDQLNRWLGPSGGVSELEKAVAGAASRIGKPKSKRYVYITVPDPIMFENFADKSSSTTYWGDIDGETLDFSRVEDQIKVCKWYIDRAREMFKALRCKNLELGGFYILSEELHLSFGETETERWNCRYKRWETIIPAIADYVHKSGEKLLWIPYHMAPGYKHWKELGIDMAWMQPNWYWDLYYGDHPFDRTIDAIKEYGMGMELEFEYSAVAAEMGPGVTGPDGFGRPIFTAKDVPALQGRVRTYMDKFKRAGLYGKAPIALYSGTDALTQLASSDDPSDRALYLDLCRFVTGNREPRGESPIAMNWLSVTDGDLTVAVDGDVAALRYLGSGSGHNYAGDEGLWRLYYNTLEEKEIEISALDEDPNVYYDGDSICIDYETLGGKAFELSLRIWIENGEACFGASLRNNEPHTIIRELQYPLVGDLNLPDGYKLLTTHTGGQVFDDPVRKISDVDVRPLYMTPAQKFRQYDLQYPRNAASNCFAFTGKRDGLYFGSHDTSLQQTWHGLRTFPDKGTIGHVTEDFKHLEAGFYRYPNVMCGDSWTNGCSVIVPYTGDWTETSRIYRRWADTWWKHDAVPEWVSDMTGWQRIIFKHQYGEYLRTYRDLPGRIREAGRSVGCDAVLAFGWWYEGMDNGYPDYTVDHTQGGDPAWKEAIREFREDGGRLILYYNGRLIDVESDFYRNGKGSSVSNRDNTGREFTEHYKFTGEGTTLGYYDSRTFVIADMSSRLWRDMLLSMADRAMDYGADAVFYDQLGVAEEFPSWDLSREFPVQDVFTGRYKAEALREIRDHVKALDPSFGLGTEWLSDCTSQFCDFVHIVEFTALPESFPEWFRYTFPEVIWSDRCVRDDNDVPRRVNNTLLKGLRNDIEVFRCRGLIDETPVYQARLAAVNAIRHDFPELLLRGRFAYMDDFTSSNPNLIAREFRDSGEGDAHRIAIVVTNTDPADQSGTLRVPGFHLVDSRTIGSAKVGTHANHPGHNCPVTIPQYSLAVLIFERD